jgi:steroid delta-isomerase-like uncharacterized protein
MSAQDNAAVARGWARAAFNQHDLEAAAQFLAPDWVGHWVGMPEGHGHEGFKRLAGAYLAAFPDMQITVEDALEVGDKVVRRISWLGTHQGPFLGVPPTGRRVRGQGIVIIQTRDGKIAEEWEMSDLLVCSNSSVPYRRSNLTRTPRSRLPSPMERLRFTKIGGRAPEL